MGKQRKGENALTLVGLELVTPGQEARVLTIRQPVPHVAQEKYRDKRGTYVCDLKVQGQ